MSLSANKLFYTNTDYNDASNALINYNNLTGNSESLEHPLSKYARGLFFSPNYNKEFFDAINWANNLGQYNNQNNLNNPLDNNVMSIPPPPGPPYADHVYFGLAPTGWSWQFDKWNMRHFWVQEWSIEEVQANGDIVNILSDDSSAQGLTDVYIRGSDRVIFNLSPYQEGDGFGYYNTGAGLGHTRGIHTGGSGGIDIDGYYSVYAEPVFYIDASVHIQNGTRLTSKLNQHSTQAWSPNLRALEGIIVSSATGEAGSWVVRGIWSGSHLADVPLLQ